MFKIKNLFPILLILLVLLPAVSFGQITTSQNTNFTGYTDTVVCTGSGLSNILCRIHKLINSIIPLLIALGVVYFIWGVVQYVIGGGEEAKKKGRDHVIYGIIGLTVIVGVWGLVNLVANTFGIAGQSVSVPTLVPTTTATSGGSCDNVLGNSPKLQSLIGYVTCIIEQSVIPLLFAVAVAFFIWGVVQFIWQGAGEEAKRTQGKQHMIWGIIALAVMLGVWGLVSIVGGTFGLNTSVLPQVRPN